MTIDSGLREMRSPRKDTRKDKVSSPLEGPAIPSIAPTFFPHRADRNIARDLLQRYADLIDAPQAFLDAATRPLPTCIWINPYKTDPPKAIAALEAIGIPDLEPVAWYPGAYRSRAWRKPGRTLPFACGWYFIQEEIALTAVRLLEPQPGDRVLDLCAAPGGKSAQIAARLGLTGVLVANEFKSPRLPSLHATLHRLGAPNIVTVQHDGRRIPLAAHSFDRVLADVPCSGEGTLRKHLRGSWRPAYSNQSSASAQAQLLDRALQLVKPGGIVVYSTCTFSPLENEAILDAVLGDRGVLEPGDIPGLQGLPGLRQWQGQHYRQDLVCARRFFPHFNDTGGFFVARIRRTEAQLSEMTPTAPEVPGVQPWRDRGVLDWFAERYGLEPSALENFALWTKSERTLWAAPQGCQPLPGLETIGLPFARLQASKTYKPTTTWLQHWGPRLQRNCVELPDRGALETFLAGGDLALSAPCESGFVGTRYGDYHLGCSHYRDGLLRSQFPKHLGSLAL